MSNGQKKQEAVDELDQMVDDILKEKPKKVPQATDYLVGPPNRLYCIGQGASAVAQPELKQRRGFDGEASHEERSLFRWLGL